MTKRVQRCVVYTRKSSEEGLDQSFNSLHAQREACEAFIKSQTGEGWSLVPTHYDDGGISGGTMQRPALQTLLADIGAGKVDVVVVYKVDRLTRSLADFAKMVELFDAHKVSFVAVTQQFNTTTSMGRLTLNVLLSFAQFEREVTGERIRDKIAASKRKGMWMGGPTPLGYTVVNRGLVVEPKEARIVERIYQSYLRLGAVRLVKRELDAAGVKSKQRLYKGAVRGGGHLFPGAIYGILRNPLYVGRIAHKGQTFTGQHEPIVEPALWEAVQKRLAENCARPRGSGRLTESSPLMGKLFDETGTCLTPKHATRGMKRSRYYVSRCLITGEGDRTKGWRLPAPMIEQTIASIAIGALTNKQLLATAAEDAEIPQATLLAMAATSAARLRESAHRSAELATVISKVDLRSDCVTVHIAIGTVTKCVTLTQSKKIVMKRRGVELRMVIDGAAAIPCAVDETLVHGLARSHKWLQLLMTGRAACIADIARAEEVSDRYISRVIRLAFLSPSLTMAVLTGSQPPEATLQKLLTSSLPLCWGAQVNTVAAPG